MEKLVIFVIGDWLREMVNVGNVFLLSALYGFCHLSNYQPGSGRDACPRMRAAGYGYDSELVIELWTMPSRRGFILHSMRPK